MYLKQKNPLSCNTTIYCYLCTCMSIINSILLFTAFRHIFTHVWSAINFLYANFSLNKTVLLLNANILKF